MSDYEVSIVEEKYTVMVGGKVYSLCETNAAEMPLVQSEKSKLLMQINLEEMLGNLLNSVDLLDIVYCSSAGIGGIPGQVSKLQTGLLRDISDSQLVMSEFVDNTTDVLDNLAWVYPNLVGNDYGQAIDILVQVREYAEEMYTKAAKLRDTFGERCSQSDDILTQTINKNSDLYAQKNKVLEEIANMNAELEAFETLKEILDEQIEEMNEEYRELEKKEEKAAKQAFQLQLTGAILGGIGELISTVIPIKELAGGGEKSEGNNDEESSQQEVEQVSEEEIAKNTKVQEKENDIADLKEKRNKLQQEIKELQERLKSCPEGQEYDALRKQAVDKQAELDQVNEKIESGQKAADKIKEALKATGSSFTAAADKQQSNVEMYNKRLQEVYRLRQEVKKQDAQNQAKIKEYTQKVAASVDRKDKLDLTVKSLTMAIGSLRRVVVILNEAALFWKSIAQCCEKLSESGLADTIKKNSENAVSEGTKPFYMQLLFVKTFLLYLIRWTALNLISNDYVAAMNKVRKELGNTIAQEEGEPEKQWEKAAALAKNLKI